MARLHELVHGALDNAGIFQLGVAHLASFVDLLAGEAEIFRCRNNLVPARNEVSASAGLANLAPHLRRVVLISKPLLCLRLDNQRVALCAGPGERES